MRVRWQRNGVRDYAESGGTPATADGLNQVPPLNANRTSSDSSNERPEKFGGTAQVSPDSGENDPESAVRSSDALIKAGVGMHPLGHADHERITNGGEQRFRARGRPRSRG